MIQGETWMKDFSKSNRFKKISEEDNPIIKDYSKAVVKFKKNSVKNNNEVIMFPGTNKAKEKSYKPTSVKYNPEKVIAKKALNIVLGISVIALLIYGGSKYLKILSERDSYLLEHAEEIVNQYNSSNNYTIEEEIHNQAKIKGGN